MREEASSLGENMCKGMKQWHSGVCTKQVHPFAVADEGGRDQAMRASEPRLTSVSVNELQEVQRSPGEWEIRVYFDMASEFRSFLQILKEALGPQGTAVGEPREQLAAETTGRFSVFIRASLGRHDCREDDELQKLEAS